jgi:F-type H+-transporting ATPase subunit b
LSVFALITTGAAAAAEIAHGEAAASSSGGLPQLDPTWLPSQIFWLAVTFGVLYWLMAARFLPAIAGAIEERKDRIADDLDQAGEFKRQAEDAQTAYHQALADAKAKAQAIAAETRAEVDAEIAQLRAETDAALEKELKSAEARIADMQARAEEKVREAARDVARAVVETLIDEAPTREAADKSLAALAGE